MRSVLDAVRDALEVFIDAEGRFLEIALVLVVYGCGLLEGVRNQAA